MASILFKGNVTMVEFKKISEHKLLKFGVAENHGFYDKDKNEWVETGTTYHNCVYWGDRAESFEPLIQKGVGVMVEGREYNKISDKKDENGNYFINREVTVETVALLLNRLESYKLKPKSDKIPESNDNNSDYAKAKSGE